MAFPLLRARTLGQKLRNALQIVIGVAMFIYTTVTLIYVLEEEDRFSTENLNALLDITAYNLEAPLIFNDPRAANDTLKALALDPGIRSARVIDKNLAAFARYDRVEHDSQSLSLIPDSLNNLRVSKDIRFKKVLIGRIEVLASREKFWKSVGIAVLIMLTATALALLAASMVARRLQRGVTEPIERLEQATRKIAESKSFSLRVAPQEDDEIGRLIHSFNTMLAEIETRDATLENYRESLEAEVASRTNELMEALAGAEEASRFKSRFLANMSHEIRTPLNGILGMMRLLLASSLPQNQHRMCETALRSSETLLQLLNDILDISKIEAGKLSLDVRPMELVEAVEMSTRMLSSAAIAQGIELNVCPAVTLPAWVMGDSHRLRQILFNLVGNAIKFTEKGEVIVRADVTGDGDKIRFSVADTGIGISEADQQRLFQAFTQADASTTRRFGGTGLGLAISRQLVGMMGAELQLSSQPGHGSVFYFDLALPVCAAPDGQGSATPRFANRRLLLVGAHPTTADCLRNLAVVMEMDCRVASTLGEARTLLIGGEWFDCIIADPRLPNIELMGLAALAPCAKWIALTQFGAQTAQAPFTGQIIKPIARRELADALGAALAPEGSQNGMAPPTMPILPSFRGHILLVEDNPTNQEATRGLLELLGCTVSVANDGQQAIEKVEQNDFDIILMDCQMPVMDGYTATGLLRQRELDQGLPPTGIIALTANSYPEERQHCLDVGMDDFLPKPFTETQLIDLLTNWLGAPETPSLVPVPAPEPSVSPDPAPLDTASLPPVFDPSPLQTVAARRGKDAAPYLRQLLATLLDDQDQQIQTLLDWQQDALAAQRQAHSLKSAAATLGVRRLSDTARRLELALITGQEAEIKVLCAALPNQFDASRKALELFVGRFG